MNEQEALKKMIAPGTRRPGKYREGVIQIWLTRACDKACFGCTQASNIRGNSGFISLEHFEQACVSLRDYFGVVGIFGGNPCLHPKFAEICRILEAHIPRNRRGLWSNKLFGHGSLCRKVFDPSVCNINVHTDLAAYNEVKRDWPEVRVFGLDNDSRHSPPYVAMQDVIEDESRRWDLISNCDINQHWSAMIAPFRDNLRAYFCEIAGAQAILHQNDPDYPDLGMAVEPGWWRKPMEAFKDQVRHHCHACGVPLRIYGELSQAAQGVEMVSVTHLEVYKPKRSEREVRVLTEVPDHHVDKVIDYLGNARR